MRIPGIDHPITIEPASELVLVRAGGRVVVDTTAALIMREAHLAPVFYLPLADVDPAAIVRSTRSTYCPFKGDASYYDVLTREGVIANAAWEYQDPYEAVREIAGHVAFYPSRVQISSTAG